MVDDRVLIVNADDFGQSLGVNAGIIQAYEHGIVTSASLMVRWTTAKEAAHYAVSRPMLSVGLQIDLGEWFYRIDDWVPVYQVVDPLDEAAVRTEVAAQLDRFRLLMGREPTHLDSHQHVHLREPLRAALIETSAQLGVPLRHLNEQVQYRGDFYGQTAEGWPYPDAITSQALIGLLHSLEPGWTEVGCHPASDADLNVMYREERPLELTVLCDAPVRQAIVCSGIRLASFLEVPQEEVRL